MNACVTWVLNVRYLWQDMTWLCDMSTEYQSFVICHGMTVWYEFWISHICDMKRQCENILNIRHLLHDMTVWHEYWLSDIFDMNLHDCVSWILNIRYLCHYMTVWHEYWISDICEMTWLYDLCTKYQTFVTLLVGLTWVLNIRYLWHNMKWHCDMCTVHQIFVAWHDCATWVLIIRHLWHNVTVW